MWLFPVYPDWGWLSYHGIFIWVVAKGLKVGIRGGFSSEYPDPIFRDLRMHVSIISNSCSRNIFVIFLGICQSKICFEIPEIIPSWSHPWLTWISEQQPAHRVHNFRVGQERTEADPCSLLNWASFALIKLKYGKNVVFQFWGLCGTYVKVNYAKL